MTTVATWQAAIVAGGREQGVDGITEIAIRSIEQELPVLLEDPDLREAARASTAANIALAVQLVQGSLSLGHLDPPPQAAAFTRELARRNVPVAELDRAYRVAQLALWRWAVAQVHERLEGDVATAIEGLSEAVFATGDVLAATVMERYAVERERWLRSADAIRTTTLRDVLGGVPLDRDAASSRLRYELRQTHDAFVVWTGGDTASPDAAAAAIGGPRALLAPFGVGIVAGWAPAGSLDLEHLEDGIQVAIGSPGAGEDGFRRGHLEAMEARRVARLLATGVPVTHYDDVALLALLTKDAAQAQRFVDRVLGPLAAPDPATVRLADTLYAAIEEQGSPRRAAHRLGVHENTVAKRLRAIEELLGPAFLQRPGELLAALEILRATQAPAPED
jgi:hypothetical protein